MKIPKLKIFFLNHNKNMNEMDEEENKLIEIGRAVFHKELHPRIEKLLDENKRKNI